VGETWEFSQPRNGIDLSDKPKLAHFKTVLLTGLIPLKILVKLWQSLILSHRSFISHRFLGNLFRFNDVSSCRSMFK
jgi:hypothetical protein